MPPAPLVPTSSLRSLLTLVVVAAFLVMGMVAISWIVRLATAQWLAASLATAAMGGLAVRLSTGSAVPAGASLGRTVGWSVLLGLANVPVSFVAASMMDDVDVRVVPVAAFATIFGAPFGLALGLLFGLVLSVPVAALMQAWEQPSPDATDGAIMVFGLWLAVATGLAASLASPVLDPQFPPGFLQGSGELDPRRTWAPHVTAWLLGGLGITLAALAWSRRTMRRRFILRVALGRVPGWRLIETGSETPPERDALAPLPCLGQTQIECDHRLVRCECPGEGAYRRAVTEWPVARVPHAWLTRPVGHETP